MEQTAMEWLTEQIKSTYDKEHKLPIGYIFDLIRQAKEKEQEQLQEAWNDGNLLGRNGHVLEEYSSGKEYYNHTYKVNVKYE